MSTITREFTKDQLIEHLKKQMKQRELHIASPATDRGFREYLELEIATNEIALASLEAEPVKSSGFIESKAEGTDKFILKAYYGQNLSVGDKLYAAPPAPVSVPDEVTAEDCPAFVKYDITEVDEAWARGFNSCRAAMLQGAEPVTTAYKLPLDYLQGHKDGLEWASRLAEANHPQTGDWLYDDPLELAKAIRKGPDMPEADGNSPVIPDGWAMVPVEPTDEMLHALYHCGTRLIRPFERQLYQDMLAAAPLQEVKNG